MLFRRRLLSAFSQRGAESSAVSEEKVVLLDDGKNAVARGRHAVSTIVRKDRVVEAVLFVVAFIVRIYRYDQPRASVFDETHFGRFISQYDLREYFFDIHPPLAKLTMYFVAKLFGFHAIDKHRFEFRAIGVPFPEDLVWKPFRIVPILFGAACVPLMFRTSRKLGIGRIISLFAALCICFDLCNVIESRLMLTDSQLIFYCGLALYLMLELWDVPLDKRVLAPTRRFALVVATGLACGAAISVKYTGLGTPGLTGLVSLLGLYFPVHGGRVPFVECVVIGAVGLSLFFTCFYIHITLLWKEGDGDAFMPAYFRETLAGDHFYKASAFHRAREGFTLPVFWFWKSVGYLNAEMIRASARIKSTHPWQSSWWTWTFTKRGVYYYSDHGGKPNHTGRIYLMGNPIVYWAVIALIVLFVCAQLVLALRRIYAFFRDRRRRFRSPLPPPSSSSEASELTASRALLSTTKKDDGDPFSRAAATSAAAATVRGVSTYQFSCVGWFLFSGWALNLLPFLDVDRPTFLYHYLPGLWYGILLASWTLHAAPARFYRAKVVLALVLLVAIIAAYLYFMPWVYMLPLSPKQTEAMRWLSTWN